MAYPLSNLLIDSLPSPDRARMLRLLEPVALPIRTELHGIGETPRYVHFITSGIASVVTEMADGEGVEIALAGREDLPESIFLLGTLANQSRCFMQVEGTALRMDFKLFQREFHQSEAVRNMVLRHVQYGAFMTAQVAACNRLHNVEERLARWLLMVAARIGSDEMHITQEFLGNMLGARRATVTLSAGALQRSGLIEYRRGYIRILNREALEDTACECFGVTQKLMHDLAL